MGQLTSSSEPVWDNNCINDDRLSAKKLLGGIGGR